MSTKIAKRRTRSEYQGLIKADETYIDEDELRKELAARFFEVLDIQRTCYPNVVVVTGRDTGAIKDYVVIRKNGSRKSLIMTCRKDLIPERYKRGAVQVLNANVIQRYLSNSPQI